MNQQDEIINTELKMERFFLEILPRSLDFTTELGFVTRETLIMLMQRNNLL